MLLKINHMLTIIIRCFALAFLASSVHIYIEYRLNPQQYLLHSSPWHTAVYINGLITLLFIAVFILCRALVRRFLRKNT